ncbi:MAG: 2-oxo acid dehydrogenase subunit E2 [Fimbriimonadaceae bacterium]|nr:2-oxo acid dehydrogenase subunit E2 [Fimbriimonadaceae bacterium]
MTEVIMPKMGDGMEEGTLVDWLKKDGEKVRTGEVIGNIQTDKATLELESPGSGILTGFLIKGGDTVPVGVPIAVLLKDGEKIPEGWGSGLTPAPQAEAPSIPTASHPSGPDVAQPATAPANGLRIKASPLAKKIAAEAGIDLSTITGTGPGGRIIERDVRGITPVQHVAKPTIAAKGDTEVPLSRLRQIIAQRTQHSKQTVPHFYVTVEVDIEKIYALRELFEQEESGKVSVNDFVVMACTRALQEMPEVNATFAENKILQYGDVHIGIAAAVDEGLLVPVVKNADQKSLREISGEVRELVKKARDGKLLPDEMSGSTFSISNMGMLNVDSFCAIINEPNAAIVAIGTAKRVPVAVDEDSDELEIRWRMNITGSFDHRVVDGAIGARFVNVVKNYLENPTKLLS